MVHSFIIIEGKVVHSKEIVQISKIKILIKLIINFIRIHYAERKGFEPIYSNRIQSAVLQN